MEKHLWILRHATAENPLGAKDFDRPLSAQGLQEVDLVGQWLSRINLAFDLIIASPACRTKQTAKIAAQNTAYPPEKIIFDQSIYEADVKSLINVILGIPDNMNNVLLVGHNPGLELLVHSCCDDHRSQRAFLLPASMVHIAFPQTWDEVLGSFGQFMDIFHVAEY